MTNRNIIRIKWESIFVVIVFFVTHRLLRLNSKKKIKRSVKKWNYLHSHNRLPVWNTIQSLNSWLGHFFSLQFYKLQKKSFE